MRALRCCPRQQIQPQESFLSACSRSRGGGRMKVQAAAGTHWGSVPTKRVWALVFKGKKDRGCLFFPAAPVGQLAIPSTGSWLIPYQWPRASASGRLQAPCPAPGLLGCSDWAAPTHHHPSRPQTCGKSSQTATTWFYLSHPKCPDPKTTKYPWG